MNVLQYAYDSVLHYMQNWGYNTYANNYIITLVTKLTLVTSLLKEKNEAVWLYTEKKSDKPKWGVCLSIVLVLDQG